MKTSGVLEIGGRISHLELIDSLIFIILHCPALKKNVDRICPDWGWAAQKLTIQLDCDF